MAVKVLAMTGGSYESDDKRFDMQRSINLYPDVHELQTGKAGIHTRMATAPGLSFLHSGTSLIRGVCKLPTGHYVVVTSIGQNSYLQLLNPETGVLTLVPVTSSYPTYTSTTSNSWLHESYELPQRDRHNVRFAYNGKDLVIVDYNSVVIRMNIGNTAPGTATTCWALMPLPTDFKANDVCFIGGYFVFSQAENLASVPLAKGRFFISRLYDTTVDPLDIASAEYKSDSLETVVALGQSLWLLGSRTIEVWGNTGAVDFPFERIQGAVQDVGCLNRGTLQQVSDTLIWLACTSEGRPFVALASGYSPNKVSTAPIDRQLYGSSKAELDAMTSFSYSWNGHYFYGLNCPHLGTTFVYDLATKAWHERVYQNQSTGDLEAVNYCHASPGLGSDDIVYRKAEAGIFKLQPNSSAFYVLQTMYCERIFTHEAVKGLARLLYHRVQVDASAGDSNDLPALGLSWSDDGGKTWSQVRSLLPSDLGEYQTRYLWNRLGSSRDRVFKLQFNTLVKMSLLSTTASVGLGYA